MIEPSHYWKEIFNQRAKKYKDDPLKQVGKTVSGTSVSADQLSLIADEVLSKLKLTKTSIVADLGCGNGLLTKKIAEDVCEISGFDFSAELINFARCESGPINAFFYEQDMANLDRAFLNTFTHVMLYEVIQHTTKEVVQNLLDKLHTSRKIKMILIGGVPDVEYIDTFYDTPEKKRFYEKTLINNTPHLGNWWHKDDLSSIAKNCGFSVNFLNQNPSLFTAYYRFDCILEKI